MATFVFRHKVGDFDAWLKDHAHREMLYAPAYTGFRTFQDGDDPNSIVIVMETEDIEKLGPIINDPKIQHIKDLHTVLEPITMSSEVKL